MNRNLKFWVFVLLLFGGFWSYFSLYVTVHSFQVAVEQKDAAAVAGYVNFPAVRESVKAGISAALLEVTSKDGKKGDGSGAALAVLGLWGSSLVSNPMVDALLTPEGLAMMLKGEEQSTIFGSKFFPIHKTARSYKDSKVFEL